MRHGRSVHPHEVPTHHHTAIRLRNHAVDFPEGTQVCPQIALLRAVRIEIQGALTVTEGVIQQQPRHDKAPGTVDRKLPNFPILHWDVDRSIDVARAIQFEHHRRHVGLLHSIRAVEVNSASGGVLDAKIESLRERLLQIQTAFRGEPQKPAVGHHAVVDKIPRDRDPDRAVSVNRYAPGFAEPELVGCGMLRVSEFQRVIHRAIDIKPHESSLLIAIHDPKMSAHDHAIVGLDFDIPRQQRGRHPALKRGLESRIQNARRIRSTEPGGLG